LQEEVKQNEELRKLADAIEAQTEEIQQHVEKTMKQIEGRKMRTGGRMDVHERTNMEMEGIHRRQQREREYGCKMLSLSLSLRMQECNQSQQRYSLHNNDTYSAMMPRVFTTTMLVSPVAAQHEMAELSGERAKLQTELDQLAGKQTQHKTSLARRKEDNDMLEAWLISLLERSGPASSTHY
jgi:predicted nuclease with TOPRIM domain